MYFERNNDDYDDDDGNTKITIFVSCWSICALESTGTGLLLWFAMWSVVYPFDNL